LSKDYGVFQVVGEENGGKGKKRVKEDESEGGGGDAKKPKGEGVQIETDLSKLDFGCDKTTKDGDKWNLKISTWNVAGLRACIKVKHYFLNPINKFVRKGVGEASFIYSIIIV
jgi:hypothetical protein